MSETAAVKPLELDTLGVARLIDELSAACECEAALPELECHEAPLDRWWLRWAREDFASIPAAQGGYNVLQNGPLSGFARTGAAADKALLSAPRADKSGGDRR